MLLKLAWRNIWRNTRRSIIILCSIVVGMTMIIFMDSLIGAFLLQSFENQIGTHTAHIQINRTGFNDNKTVQNYLPDPGAVESTLFETTGIMHHSRRIVTFGLVNSAYNSSGITLIGVDPDDEQYVTTIKNSVIEGRYFTGDAHEIVMSRRTAETLGVGPGDRIVGMASALDGSVGAEMFRVVGLFRTMSSGFDKAHVYVPLETAQRMLGLGDNVSQFALIAESVDIVPDLRENLQSSLGDEYEVLSYAELMPLLMIMMDLSRQSSGFIYIIIGAAMIFGIINALLMSVFERIREFGVLMSIGMKNSRMFSMILLEALILGVIGTAAGTVFGGGLTMILQYRGMNLAAFSEGLAAWGIASVLHPELSISVIVKAIIIILCTCVLASIWPAVKAMRLKPVEAMRYV